MKVEHNRFCMYKHDRNSTKLIHHTDKIQFTNEFKVHRTFSNYIRTITCV